MDQPVCITIECAVAETPASAGRRLIAAIGQRNGTVDAVNTPVGRRSMCLDLESTQVQAGRLVIVVAGTLPDGTRLTVGSGATFLFDPSYSAANLASAGLTAPALDTGTASENSTPVVGAGELANGPVAASAAADVSPLIARPAKHLPDLPVITTIRLMTVVFRHRDARRRRSGAVRHLSPNTRIGRTELVFAKSHPYSGTCQNTTVFWDARWVLPTAIRYPSLSGRHPGRQLIAVIRADGAICGRWSGLARPVR
jgi:hypothetical protein